jgi:CRP-like cAMP-binding protein
VLTSVEHERLQPYIEGVVLQAGARLFDAGAPLRHVYFPTTAVISLVASMRDGASMEVAVVGNEGVAGVCAFMDSEEALCSGVVLNTGHAWRIGVRTIAEPAGSFQALMPALLRYLRSLFTQIAQTSACNRHHAVDQQLCRWLLLHADRLDSCELQATQERIAHMLGVRREGVTASAGKLQVAGLIRYGRGRISIVDRKGLEQLSCECYSVMRQAQDRLGGLLASQYGQGEHRGHATSSRQRQAA